MTATEPRATATVASPRFAMSPNRVGLTRVSDHPKCGHCSKPILLRPADRDLGLGVRHGHDRHDRAGRGGLLRRLVRPVQDHGAAARRCRRSRRAGQILFAKIDTDRNPLTGPAFGIRGIPTLIAFRKGKEVARRVGAVPPAELENFLEQDLVGPAQRLDLAPARPLFPGGGWRSTYSRIPPCL